MGTLNAITQTLWRPLRFYATRSAPYRKIYNKRIQKITGTQNLRTPLSVYIEPTNRCNSDCRVCPRKAMTRAQGVMDMKLYKKVVDECAALGVKWAVLQMFGEPFMDKTFLNKARIAKDKGLKTSIYTNGALLSKRKIAQIIDEQLLDHLVVSIDGADAAEYNQNRPTLNLKKVEANVRHLLAQKEKAGNKVPKVKIHCTQLPGVHYDKKEFTRKWASITDGVTFTPTRDWGGQIPGVSTIKKPKQRYACFLLWNQFYVLWDGRVTFCSIDFDGKYAFGNLRQQSLSDLWQSGTMMDLRQLHLESRINDNPLCGECVFSTHEKTWWWQKAERVLF